MLVRAVESMLHFETAGLKEVPVDFIFESEF
jgi:hypothetical protein